MKKNLKKFFVLFTLILGVISLAGCQWNVDGEGSTVIEEDDAPSGFETILSLDGEDIPNLFYREIGTTSEITIRFSMPKNSYLKYTSSDVNTGIEFDTKRGSFKPLPNTKDSRSQKTTENISKRYVLVAFWDKYDEKADWDKAIFGIVEITSWILKNSYTQAETWDGIKMSMGYKLVEGSDVIFVADYESGGRLIYELDSVSRQIMPTDTNYFQYDAGVNGIDVGDSIYINFAYWQTTDNKPSLNELDWSTAKKGWVKVNYNSSEIPFLSIAGVRQYGNSISLSEGTAITINATVSNAPVYVIWRSGSAVTVPTETEWNTASNQVGTYNLNVSYSGNPLFTVFARTKESGKTWSENAQWSFTPISSQTTNVSVQSISLSYTNMSLNVGGSGTLVTTFFPTNSSNQAVNFASDNTSVATVTSTGTVYAVGVGVATITATAQDVTNGVKTASCAVTVTGGTTPSSSEKYFYIDSSWANQKVKITFENGDGTSGEYTIASDGKVPVAITGTPKLTISLTANGQWLDASGNPNAYSQCQTTDWNGDSVTLTSYTNGTFTPTGRTTIWTRK